MTENINYAELERLLGYIFTDRSWLAQALIHSSYAYEYPASGPSNERLEFLGDAVLNLVISDLLVALLPQAPEGLLSRRRAALVNTRHLADIAAKLRLGACLCLGRGEERQSGRTKTSVLADAVEAVVGAVYLDGGFAAAKEVVKSLFADSLASISESQVDQDYKTCLQEYVQKWWRVSPEYHLLQTTGPAHAREFEVEVWVAGTPMGRGRGHTKKQASQEAAQEALVRLQRQSQPDT